MGVTNDEFVIIKGNPKDLRKVAKYFKKILKKDSDYENFTDCVGKVGGGMNGKYSLVIVPSGYNGGWKEDVMESLKEKVAELQAKAEQKNLDYRVAQKELGGKGYAKFKWPISMSVLRFADWGDSFTNDDGEVFDLSQQKQAHTE